MKRFNYVPGLDGGMRESEVGEWLKYEDPAELLKQFAEGLRQQLAEVIRQRNVLSANIEDLREELDKYRTGK